MLLVDEINVFGCKIEQQQLKLINILLSFVLRSTAYQYIPNSVSNNSEKQAKLFQLLRT